MLDRDTLLAAAAANHRSWFRRLASATGGTVERGPELDLIVDGKGHATIAFPPPAARTPARVAHLVAQAEALGARTAACWSLERDRALGVELLANGFEWGWQPHWMAIALADLSGAEPAHEVDEGTAPHPRTRRLVVRDGDDMIGSVSVNPWQGSAGIYDMWVAEPRQRQGYGRALMLAAGAVAVELGCTHAVLNATDEGEQLYRRVGFESLGWGQTWWMHQGPRPSTRQGELVRAIGADDAAALAALDPSSDELAEAIPGPGVPLAVAVVLGRPEAADWILTRRPALVAQALEDNGATLLHVAVEADDEAMVRVALAHGADLLARDRTWHATPLDWAEFLGHTGLAELLRSFGT
jgi:GNAT superfamily N-acetyltransferase